MHPSDEHAPGRSATDAARSDWAASVTFGLAFYSGGLAGRVLPVPVGEVRIGRSSKSDLRLPSDDATVSGRHAVLTRREGRFELRDVESRSGTYLNGRRLSPGEPATVKPGDWILFGAAGAVAMLVGPQTVMPASWLIVEAEAESGKFVAITDEQDVRVALDGNGKLAFPYPANAPGGFRFRLDRTPPVVQPVSSRGKVGTKRVVRPGSVLRPGEGRLGVRVLGVGMSAEVVRAMGKSTVYQAVYKVVRRRSTWPLAVTGLILVAAIVLAVFKFQSSDEKQEADTARLEEADAALARSLEALGERMEIKFAAQRALFTASLDGLDARTRKQVESTRQELGAQIEAERRRTEERLRSLSRSEREQFADVLDRYSASVFLIYVEHEFPTLRLPNGRPLEQAGWGTGWIVREDGLLITNKHVVDGWKFDPLLMAHLGPDGAASVVTRIYAWANGTRFSSGGALNTGDGYNNAGRGNLRFVSAPPDRWDATIVDVRGTPVNSRSHNLDANDMAALKLSGSGFVPLPLMRDPTRAKPLDAVLVLGFSLGAGVLERGMADVSATMGTIRFVRDTVKHSATTHPGSSGGPVLTLDGEVVALHNAGVGETFNQGLRSDLVLQFVQSLR